MTIWCDNDTVICIDADDSYGEQRLFFTLTNVGNYDLHCAIYGKTDAAIAETVTFFWSLVHKATGETSLEIQARPFEIAPFFRLFHSLCGTARADFGCESEAKSDLFKKRL
jgi:hypothetical protein